MNTLQRKIMRGIYYAHILRLASLPGVWQGFVMLGVMIVLTRYVSLWNVLHNLSQVEIRNVGVFFYNAVRTTELWTLLAIGTFIFLSLSLRFSLNTKHDHSYSFARV